MTRKRLVSMQIKFTGLQCSGTKFIEDYKHNVRWDDGLHHLSRTLIVNNVRAYADAAGYDFQLANTALPIKARLDVLGQIDGSVHINVVIPVEEPTEGVKNAYDGRLEPAEFIAAAIDKFLLDAYGGAALLVRVKSVEGYEFEPNTDRDPMRWSEMVNP